MKNLAFLLIAVFIIASCTNPATKQKEGDKIPSDLENFQSEVETNTTDAPSIANVALTLEMSGASFMPELINDPQNVEKYKVTPYLAAANLGVYSTDIVYQAAYTQQQGAAYSYNAAKDLGNYIGIGEVFDDIFLQRSEEGLTKEDSVIFKLNRAIAHSENVLSEKEQARLFTALLIGSNIQELYIVNNVIFNYDVDLPEEAKLQVLRQVILALKHQVEDLEVFTKLFAEYTPETDVAKQVYELMKSTIDSYSKVKFEDQAEKLTAKEFFENEHLLAAFEDIKELRKLIIAE